MAQSLMHLKACMCMTSTLMYTYFETSYGCWITKILLACKRGHCNQRFLLRDEYLTLFMPSSLLIGLGSTFGHRPTHNWYSYCLHDIFPIAKNNHVSCSRVVQYRGVYTYISTAVCLVDRIYYMPKPAYTQIYSGPTSPKFISISHRVEQSTEIRSLSTFRKGNYFAHFVSEVSLERI